MVRPAIWGGACGELVTGSRQANPESSLGLTPVTRPPVGQLIGIHSCGREAKLDRRCHPLHTLTPPLPTTPGVSPPVKVDHHVANSRVIVRQARDPLES